MNNKINFSFEEISSIITRIQEEAHSIQKDLNECDAIVDENANVPNRWYGERAAGFKTEWKKAAAEFSSFVKEVDEIAGNIKFASNTYNQVEDKKSV